MDTQQYNTELWTALREKWVQLDAEGHKIKVDFNILKDPQDEKKDLAIDVAQNIDGEWVVQTVQQQPREAYPVLGIEGLGTAELLALARGLVGSLTETIPGTEAEETHLVMKRIAPESAEISGYVVSKTGEKVSLRTNYQHYYVLNEILEQTSYSRQKRYSELQVHRNQGDEITFRVVPA